MNTNVFGDPIVEGGGKNVFGDEIVAPAESGVQRLNPTEKAAKIAGIKADIEAKSEQPGILSRVAAAVGSALEPVVEPLTPSGLMNQPTRAANYLLGRNYQDPYEQIGVHPSQQSFKPENPTAEQFVQDKMEKFGTSVMNTLGQFFPPLQALAPSARKDKVVGSKEAVNETKGFAGTKPFREGEAIVDVKPETVQTAATALAAMNQNNALLKLFANDPVAQKVAAETVSGATTPGMVGTVAATSGVGPFSGARALLAGPTQAAFMATSAGQALRDVAEAARPGLEPQQREEAALKGIVNAIFTAMLGKGPIREAKGPVPIEAWDSSKIRPSDVVGQAPIEVTEPPMKQLPAPKQPLLLESGALKEGVQEPVKRPSTGATPIIGQPNPDAPIQVSPYMLTAIKNALEQKQIVRAPGDLKGEAKQGGQVSFEGRGIPSARQSTAMLRSGLDPDELKPALLVGGKPLTGGDTHAEIMRNSLGNVEDPRGLIQTFQDDKSHVFVDGKGNVLDRDQAAKALGLTEPLHSEKLSELQSAKLRSGIDPEGAFDLKGLMLARRPEELGFRGETVDAQQFVNRLRNKLGADSQEWKSIWQPTVGGLKGKMTPGEIVQKMEESAPRVEVRKFGPGSSAEAQREYAEVQHRLDTLDPEWRRITPDELWRRHGQDAMSLVERWRELNAEVTRSESAQGNEAHWSFVASKTESEMPGYVEGAVTIPKKPSMTSEEFNKQPIGFGPEQRKTYEGEFFPSSHSFPPNTLGFFRGYMETTPEGKKVFHVIEVQSDWAKIQEEASSSVPGGKVYYTSDGRQWPTREEATKWMKAMHPLLGDWERFSLKAAVDHAIKEGADEVALSDAETAMMSEGHDRAAELPRGNYATREGAEAGLVALNRQRGGDTGYEVRQQANGNYELAKRGGEISQEPGMRLHYDRTGPKILEEMTGSKGERREFGEHKMAMQTGIGPRGEQRAGTIPREDLIFRNPDGTPKTSITAQSFPLEGLKKTKGSEPFTAMGNRTVVGEGGQKYVYSGLPVERLKDDFKRLFMRVDQDRKTLQHAISSRDIKSHVAMKATAMENAALVTQAKAENHMTMVAKRDFGKDAEKADLAIVPILESGFDKAKLDDFLVKAKDNKDAIEGIEFAKANWNRLMPMVKDADAIDAQNIAYAKSVGIELPVRNDYIKRMYEDESQGMFFKERHPMGVGAGSKQARKYPTIYDAIADGRKPLSLKASALIGKRTAEIMLEVNQKTWVEGFKNTLDPMSKKPVVQDAKYTSKGSVVPEGYSPVNISPGQTIAVLNGYKNIFKAVTGESAVSASLPGQALLQAEGAIKHGTLVFDSFHAFRIYQFRKSLGLKGTYKHGLSLLEYSKSDLDEAIRQKLVPADAKAYVEALVETPQGTLTRREVATLGIKNGLGVGRHSEALYTSFIRDTPGLKQTVGTFNRFVFDKLSRGAIMEAFQNEFERIANNRPELSHEEVARMASRDINFRMGNIGRQGIFKSKTMQDVMRLAFLAPNWVESMAQSEVRSAAQMAKATVPGKGFLKPGTLAKSTGNLLLAYVAGTQILNYLTTGHSTLENPDDAHKLDAYVPPIKKDGQGFYISPLSVTAELTHDMIRYMHAGKTAPQSAGQIVENKLSPLSHATEAMVWGKDWSGQELDGTWDRVKAAAWTLAPTPLPLRQAMRGVSEKDIAPIERQAFAMAGLKAEPETKRSVDQRLMAGKSLQERAAMLKQRKGAMTQEDFEKANERRYGGAEYAIKRQKQTSQEAEASLSKEARQWAKARAIRIPGYGDTITQQQMKVPLSPKETERMKQLVVEAYEKEIATMWEPQYGFDKKSLAEQQRYASARFAAARASARERLKAEIQSGSMVESNQPEKKRFSFLHP